MRKVRKNPASHKDSMEPFWGLKGGSIEPFGGFDRTFLGRLPISGHRFKIPSVQAKLKISSKVDFFQSLGPQGHQMREPLQLQLRLLVNYPRAGRREGRFPIQTCPSFFVLFLVLFCTFPIFRGFPGSAGIVPRFSRCVFFLFLCLVTAPTRDSPERAATQSGPSESGKPPSLETPLVYLLSICGSPKIVTRRQDV